MTKKIDIDKAHKDNPELPRKFIEEVVQAAKEIERGECSPYKRGQRYSEEGESESESSR